jgi:hypothetical protein
MVLDLFGTISPQADVIDNDNDDMDANDTTHADGDGTTNGPRELFVPGRINVNTAPLHMLTLTAPLPEAVANIENLMLSVMNYRENFDLWRNVINPHTADPNWRAQPGILSLAELMWVNPDDNIGSSADMQGYLGSGAPLSGGIDLNPLPVEIPGRANSPVEEDAEARIARLQFLNQVFTTRSDVYTAYVEIRGYPSHDYRLGPVERTRFLVVLDRGRITGADDQVRVLAMYRY